MFTGIVEEVGEVVAVEKSGDGAVLTVRGPRVVADASHGNSIAVDGVCLTVTATVDDSTGGAFTADVTHETLRRTTLGALTRGARVNLERPVSVGERLGGHLVQGHVDGTGTILSRTAGGCSPVVRIAVPPGLARYLAEKGSIAVDGVSLTVSAVGKDWFEVCLIPETLRRTTLGGKRPGEPVNLEVDVLAKYVERLLEPVVRR